MGTLLAVSVVLNLVLGGRYLVAAVKWAWNLRLRIQGRD